MPNNWWKTFPSRGGPDNPAGPDQGNVREATKSWAKVPGKTQPPRKDGKGGKKVKTHAVSDGI